MFQLSFVIKISDDQNTRMVKEMARYHVKFRQKG